MPPNKDSGADDRLPETSEAQEALGVRFGETADVAPSVERTGVQVAVETPVNLVYGSVPFAVMMTSPEDLEDFAFGFSFTEGIIDHADDIRGLRIHVQDGQAGAQDGVVVDMTLRAEMMQRHLGRARNLSGRTGCGVCGIADLQSMPRAEKVRNGRRIATHALRRAMRETAAHQKLNRKTHSVHAAAFCGMDGGVLVLREDVGRHNALDKLIGHMLRTGHDPADGLVLVTSRASYEMVEKAARLGAHTLAAISAPTSLAVARAREYGMTLIAVARDDGAIVFAGRQFADCKAPDDKDDA